MENPGYEKDNLKGPPGYVTPAGPPPYGAVNPPGAQPPPPTQYYQGGYPMPGPGGMPPMNPHFQGYSPVYGDDQRAPIDVTVTRTTVITPLVVASQPDYLCFSIFNLLCCCLPLGIVALIYSLKTQDCNARGDLVGARHNSETARTMNRIAFALGFTIFIIYLICVIVLVIIPNNQHLNHPLH
ncbi:interferon-induced transmembrane protein 3-like [Lissotriton helveticus]